MTIQPLTLEALRTQAREAAEQHIPLEQANHHETGTTLWREFNGAYYAACRARDREEDSKLIRVLYRRPDIRTTV